MAKPPHFKVECEYRRERIGMPEEGKKRTIKLQLDGGNEKKLNKKEQIT